MKHNHADLQEFFTRKDSQGEWLVHYAPNDPRTLDVREEDDVTFRVSACAYELLQDHFRRFPNSDIGNANVWWCALHEENVSFHFAYPGTKNPDHVTCPACKTSWVFIEDCLEEA